MTWPLLKHRCIVSRVGLSGTGCETATQPHIPPLKRLFSSRGLLHEVASSTMRRLMKELGVSAECKHQFVKLSRKVAASPWKVQHSIGPCGNWHANPKGMRQSQVCTTDNFVFPLLVLLLLKPVRSVCLSPQAAAEKTPQNTQDNTALFGVLPIKVDKPHARPLSATYIMRPSPSPLPLELLLLLLQSMRDGRLNGNRSVAVEKVVGERAASIEVFKTIDIGP
ncbi:hypothetical protein HPB50_002720 [Hyalomma asiaticum]|uniref:Uncharacterized protein n=1 Tax=Hyalomma asiaticum TaxID=266040 RepID=A0ACB7TG47_HYAAI|nr:hypothetical protein HPB50_002720 [Hyalomma asiaticum]